jgi:hypothetical protein
MIANTEFIIYVAEHMRFKAYMPGPGMVKKFEYSLHLSDKKWSKWSGQCCVSIPA